jgi:hypothetical protein
MSRAPWTRAQGALLALAVALLSVLAILADASRQRAERDAARNDAVVALTGLPDLALSSSVRWLRHPSQTEPAAAASDLPASLDMDPAGAWIGPPRAVFHAIDAIDVRRSRR